MRKTSPLKKHPASRNPLGQEYRFDYRRAKPNRFARKMSGSVVMVVLEPDVAAVFNSSKAVNAALAHLGLGRAYALQAGVPGSAGVPPTSGKEQRAGKMPALPGDALAEARAAYEDLFALWKDADPDIPILKQAKAEYARLLRSTKQ